MEAVKINRKSNVS